MAVAVAASDSPKLSLADAALALCTGGAFAAVLQAQGGYEVRGWGLLGLGLVALVVLQLAAGRRPTRPVVAAGAALVALGAWSALSALRGGITGEAFSYGDRLVVAAAALLAGSMLARGGREARFAVVGVVGGAAAIAAEVLVVLPFAPRHGGWLLNGILIGPVGYKNAQGAVFAIAIPLAVLLVQAAGRTARAAAMFAAVLLLGGLFLTESRGALGALVLALVAQMLLDRRTGVLRAVLVLAVAGAALFGTLALVNAQLTSHPARALGQYALVTFAAAFLAAAAAIPHAAGPPSRRALAVVTAVFVLGTVTTAAIVALHVATSEGERAPRLTDLTLRGRADAWSAAWTLSRRDLLLGNGVGSFARQWPLLRPSTGPHILQPHSVELEQLAELGLLGLALFGGSWLLLFRCARGCDRPLSVAAQCVAAVLVIQASVDWTWSFPGLVAAVMLVLGLAAGGSRQSARARPLTEAVVVGLAAVALGIFAVPYLSDRALARASGNLSSRPATALAQARSAIRLYPWDQRAYALEGSILGSAGDYTAAANAYAEAASRALEPWVHHLDEARAAVQAQRIPLARTACEAALRENPYAVDDVLALCPRPDGRAWPLAALPAVRLAPPFSRLLVSRGCDGCRVTVAGARVSARVAGGFPFEDTAVAVAPLAGAAGLRGLLHVQVRLALQRAPASHLVFLEVRDTHRRLVFSLFVEGPSRQLMVYNPPGGFDSQSFVAPIGGYAPLGGSGVAISVDLLRNTYAEFRVGGRLGLRFPGAARAAPAGARTGTPTEVEAGIDGYDSSRLDDPIEVTIGGLRAGISPARRSGS